MTIGTRDKNPPSGMNAGWWERNGGATKSKTVLRCPLSEILSQCVCTGNGYPFGFMPDQELRSEVSRHQIPFHCTDAIHPTGSGFSLCVRTSNTSKPTMSCSAPLLAWISIDTLQLYSPPIHTYPIKIPKHQSIPCRARQSASTSNNGRRSCRAWC
jgi:hypothetical protein